MSTEIKTNQVGSDVRASVAGTSQLSQPENRQNIAAVQGNVVPPQAQQQEATAEKLQEVVAQLNDHVQMVQRDLHLVWMSRVAIR